MGRECVWCEVSILGQLEMMERDEVNYVSVKLSSVVSQIIALDRVGTL